MFKELAIQSASILGLEGENNWVTTFSSANKQKMSFLNLLSFDRLLWLIPIFFMFHNLEEAPFVERWSKRLPLKIHPYVTTPQFSIAITVLTIAGFLVTFLEIKYLYRYTGYLMILGIQAILLFNALIPLSYRR